MTEQLITKWKNRDFIPLCKCDRLNLRTAVANSRQSNANVHLHISHDKRRSSDFSSSQNHLRN